MATDNRDAEVAELLVGAIDLHCHSGPAAMPRILDHHEELLDAAAAKRRSLSLVVVAAPLLIAFAVPVADLVTSTGVGLVEA